MQSTERFESLLDCFAPFFKESVSIYMRRAQLCSRLAKKCGRSLREKLYELKNRNLNAARRVDRGQLVIECDNQRYWGLLSVRERKPNGIWLHTDEPWLKSADRPLRRQSSLHRK